MSLKFLSGRGQIDVKLVPLIYIFLIPAYEWSSNVSVMCTNDALTNMVLFASTLQRTKGMANFTSSWLPKHFAYFSLWSH